MIKKLSESLKARVIDAFISGNSPITEKDGKLYLRFDSIEISQHNREVEVKFLYNGECAYVMYSNVDFSAGDTLTLSNINAKMRFNVETTCD